MSKFTLRLAFVLTFVCNAAAAQHPVIKAIARDVVDICVLDLQGGDSKALLAKRGYSPEGSTTRRLVFYEKAYGFKDDSGKSFSVSPVLSIEKSETRKRLSKCGLRPMVRQSTAQLVYNEMQIYAKSLGFRTSRSSRYLMHEKNGFAFGLSGTLHTSYTTMIFTRF